MSHIECKRRGIIINNAFTYLKILTQKNIFCILVFYRIPVCYHILKELICIIFRCINSRISCIIWIVCKILVILQLQILRITISYFPRTIHLLNAFQILSLYSIIGIHHIKTDGLSFLKISLWIGIFYLLSILP